MATAGGGLGTVVTPPVLAALLPVLGLPGTLRAAGLVSAGVLVACVPACPGRPRPAGRRTPAAGRPSAGPGWRLLAAATVGLTAAMFVPFTHLPGYAAAHGTDPAGGAALVALAGAASLTGRLLAVPAQARWGAWAVHRAGAAVFCGAFALWATAAGPTGLTAFAVVFGLGHGAYLGVAAAVVLQLHGTDALALRIGSLHAATAVGGLVGPAAAGVAADLTGSPSAAVAVGAALGVAGCAVLAAVRPTAVTGRPAGSAGAAQPPRCRSIA
ncbi:hypothetical protein HOP40_25320 [Pseudonocardia broussonetiae]|uniref:Uncharacterized protein n=1 Tax=Pseudonocardia broussonetiae TaxID=2736640 RepID=A0A6M6JN85_9PSEU|nr:hypothetical protein HOP40_25320 [Pseudonocardia broussonetiae]